MMKLKIHKAAMIVAALVFAATTSGGRSGKHVL